MLDEGRSHFLLNQGMSRTLLGTLSVVPFRPSSDFLEGTVMLVASLALATVFLATALALLAELFALPFAFVAVFFVAAVAFSAVFLAAAVAFFADVFEADFAFVTFAFAAPVTLSAAFAAALIFLATAALTPASSIFFAPALANFPTVSIFAETSFFAVAAPTPGSAVNASIFEEPFLAAIVSLATPCKVTLFNTSPLIESYHRCIDGSLDEPSQ